MDLAIICTVLECAYGVQTLHQETQWEEEHHVVIDNKYTYVPEKRGLYALTEDGDFTLIVKIDITSFIGEPRIDICYNLESNIRTVTHAQLARLIEERLITSITLDGYAEEQLKITQHYEQAGN